MKRKCLRQRESEVLHLIADEHTNQEIAEKLYISNHTEKPRHFYTIEIRSQECSRHKSLMGLLTPNLKMKQYPQTLNP